MRSLFPLFLKLEGRRCLVVGAAEIGEPKIAGLLDTAGIVDVVAPHATEKLEEGAQERKIHWFKRKFHDSDLDGCLLVIVATSSRELQERIHRLARRRGLLCNVVDVPGLCDFYYPAVVKRGALQIAISTGGESPALAHRLRKELEAQFGPEYEDWLAELAVRHEIEVRNQPHFFAGHPQLGIGARTASLWRNLPRARMPSIADCNEGKEESQAGRCPRTPRGEILNRRPRREPRRD